MSAANGKKKFHFNVITMPNRVDRHYSFASSLMNQGFDVHNVSWRSGVPYNTIHNEDELAAANHFVDDPSVQVLCDDVLAHHAKTLRETTKERDAQVHLKMYCIMLAICNCLHYISNKGDPEQLQVFIFDDCLPRFTPNDLNDVARDVGKLQDILDPFCVQMMFHGWPGLEEAVAQEASNRLFSDLVAALVDKCTLFIREGSERVTPSFDPLLVRRGSGGPGDSCFFMNVTGAQKLLEYFRNTWGTGEWAMLTLALTRSPTWMYHYIGKFPGVGVNYGEEACSVSTPWRETQQTQFLNEDDVFYVDRNDRKVF